MTNQKKDIVTMRIRIGGSELEVTGPQDFVEEKIAEFVESIKTISSAPSDSQVKTSVPTSSAVGSTAKPMAINQFMKKLGKVTEIGRVLAAGYYLEKFKECDNFTAADIREAIKESRNPPPKNTSDAINKNIKKGFMMAAGNKDKKMAFVLTTDGEQHIVDLIESAG